MKKLNNTSFSQNSSTNQNGKTYIACFSNFHFCAQMENEKNRTTGNFRAFYPIRTFAFAALVVSLDSRHNHLTCKETTYGDQGSGGSAIRDPSPEDR